MSLFEEYITQKHCPAPGTALVPGEVEQGGRQALQADGSLQADKVT